MSNPIEHELALVRDENIRLRHVVAKADAWRETLNLPQQELGCFEFNEAWEEYDNARSEVADLIPQPACSVDGCGDLVFYGGLCDEHQEEAAAKKGKR